MIKYILTVATLDTTVAVSTRRPCFPSSQWNPCSSLTACKHIHRHLKLLDGVLARKPASASKSTLDLSWPSTDHGTVVLFGGASRFIPGSDSNQPYSWFPSVLWVGYFTYSWQCFKCRLISITELLRIEEQLELNLTMPPRILQRKERRNSCVNIYE